MSNYCVLDINKIKSRALLQTVYNHNTRISRPINAEEELADRNEEWLVPGASDLVDALDQKIASTEEDPDELLYAGFSKETARSFIDNFDKYLDEN